MPAWPSTLPQLVNEAGYTETRKDAVLRTSMDTGPQKRRKRTNATVTAIPASWVMTTAQLAILDTFYVTTIQLGSMAFTIPHPRLGTTVSVVFSAPYTIAPYGTQWMVSAPLEIQP